MLKQQNFFDRNIPAWKQVLFSILADHCGAPAADSC